METARHNHRMEGEGSGVSKTSLKVDVHFQRQFWFDAKVFRNLSLIQWASQKSKPKAERVSPGAVIFYFRLPKYFDFPHNGPCKISGSCCGITDALPSIYLTSRPQPEQSSASPFSHSQRTPSHPAAALSWLSAPDFSIHCKTARRRNFTQRGSHSPKWTDSHYLLHNPHLELVLNFSDQAEVWRQLSQITSSLGCFYFLLL